MFIKFITRNNLKVAFALFTKKKLSNVKHYQSIKNHTKTKLF